MLLRVGLENGADRRCIAWALDLPGCFAYGPDGASAVAALPSAVIDYAAWIESRAEPSWLPDLSEIHVRVIDAWQVYFIGENYVEAEDGYEVNAWFRDDWRPLTEVEVERYRQMLGWSRLDLLAALRGAAPAALEEKQPGERWSVNGVLNHIGSAEWWYLDRLGLAGLTREQLPADPIQRLPLVRSRLEAALPALAGLDRVTGVDGEFWSPRKVLRRTLQHERDHTLHIRRLLHGG